MEDHVCCVLNLANYSIFRDKRLQFGNAIEEAQLVYLFTMHLFNL